MTTTLIAAADLPRWAKFGVMVDGVPIYRSRNGWHISRPHGQQILQRIFKDLPTQPDERLISGYIGGAGYDGLFTARQSQAFAAEATRLVRAARRATRPQRDAHRSARRTEAEQRLAAAFA